MLVMLTGVNGNCQGKVNVWIVMIIANILQEIGFCSQHTNISFQAKMSLVE